MKNANNYFLVLIPRHLLIQKIWLMLKKLNHNFLHKFNLILLISILLPIQVSLGIRKIEKINFFLPSWV